MENNHLYLCFEKDKLNLLDSQDDIRRITEKKLNELYAEKLDKDIMLRYEDEIAKIYFNYFDSIYMFLYSIVNKAKEDNEIVILKGTITSSLVAYLLGISNIDPIKYNIPFEICSGINGSIEPNFELEFSTKYVHTIYQYVESMLKDNNVPLKAKSDITNSKILKLNFLQNQYLDILKELELTTKIKCSDINVNDKKLLNQNIDTKGLMEFEYERLKKIMAKIKPENIEDMIKIVSLVHGTGLWENNVEILINEHSINELLCSRDDIYNYLIKSSIDMENSFDIMEFIRKGKPYRIINNKIKDKEQQEDLKIKWQEYKNILLQHQIPDWQVKYFEKILYMFPKSHSATYCIYSLCLVWYKTYYSNEFKKILEKY